MFRRLSLTASNSDTRKTFTDFIAFLKSEIWSMPISQFMEINSLIFDREVECHDPEKLHKCHDEFAKLVHELVDAYCKDSNMSIEDLLQTLKSTDNLSKLTTQEKTLLEPIVAARDYDVFVPIMMRKNIELQLQALKVVQHLVGHVPSSLKLQQEDEEMWNTLFDEDESDRLILISVLKQSRSEWDRDQRLQAELLTQMELALRESFDEKPRLESLINQEQRNLDQALKKNENAFSILSVHFDPNTSTVITNAASANIYPSVSSNSAAAEVQLAQNDRPNHVHHNVILKTREGAEQKRRQSIVAAIIEEPAEVSDRSLLAKKRASLTQTSEEKTALIDNTSKPATVTTIKQGGVNGHLKTAALEDVRPSINKPSNDDRSNDQQKQTECIAQSITSKQTTNKKVEAKSVQQKAAEGKKPDATKITTSEETQGAKKVEAKKQISLGEVQVPTRHSQAPQESTEFTALGYKALLKDPRNMMVPEELLKARMQYLREQRDKLLFKKNKERERQLKELAISQRNRPFSSKVAARAVSQNLIDERKEIARKLKNEVINK